MSTAFSAAATRGVCRSSCFMVTVASKHLHFSLMVGKSTKKVFVWAMYESFLALGDGRKMLLRQHCQLLPTHISPPVVTESTAAEREEKVTHLFSGSSINKVNPFIFCTGVPQGHCGARIPTHCYWMHTGAPADFSGSEQKDHILGSKPPTQVINTFQH